MIIDKDTSRLFALLRDALWRLEEDIPATLSESECQRLLTMAKKQAVMGLVIDALTRHQVKMPQMTVFEIVSVLEQVKNRNRIVNGGVKQLHLLMEGNGIRYSVMKGQVAATYYPDTLLRQSGDIDYYCPPKDFEHSLEVVKEKWDVLPEIHGSEKHADFRYKDNVYEPHYALTSLHGKKRNEYWQQLVANDQGADVIIDGVQIRTLSPVLHVLFVFLHLYFHLMALGVGLRQFCDWAVMLYHCSEKDRVVLREHLHALGLESVWRACGCILSDYLGLPEEYLGYNIAKSDRRYGKRILSIVLYRGNMGHYNKWGGFHGWKHNVESFGIKVAHFVKFVPLAPGYTCRWLWDEVWRKMKCI